jgi:hypothetical protein
LIPAAHAALPSLDSLSEQRDFPRFAKIVRLKRKLPAAPASAGGFFSCGFGTRRQMRMYAQIFSSARKKLKNSPLQGKRAIRARPLRLVSVLNTAGGERHEPLLVRPAAAKAQTKADEQAVRRFLDAWAKHDGHALAKIMGDDGDFAAVA